MGRQNEAPLVIIACLILLSGCGTDSDARQQRLLETGDRYFEEGKYREASLIYGRALQEDRRFGEAYYKLGLAQRELGRISPAIASLTRATELLPDNEDAYGKLADLYLTVFSGDQGNRDAYLRELNRLTERAEEHFPDSFDVYRVRGVMALVEDDYETATERFRLALEKNPEDASVAVGLAEGFQGLGELERAEELARAFLEDHPSATIMHNFLYSFLYQADRRDEALEVLAAKVEHNPESIGNWLQLARHHYVAGDEESAEEVLEELLGRPSVDPTAFRRVGDFYNSTRDFDRAIAAYRKGAAALPAEKTIFELKVVETLATQGQGKQAYDMVDGILREDSQNSHALALRAALLLQTGEPEALQAAINDFEVVLSRMPENVVLRYNLGEVYLTSGNRDRAIVEFQQAIEKRPDYLLPRYGLARVYLLSQDYARAVAIADEILQLQPDNETARLIRSFAWVNMGEQRQARSALETMLEERPEASEATYQLARLSMIQRDYRQAEQLYEKLASATPPDRRGILGLVETRLATGRRDEGLALLREQVEQNPDDLWWRLAMGVAATRAGDWSNAEASLREVLEVEQDNADAVKHLAGVYYRTGRLEAARQQFQRAAELSATDPVPRLYLALIAEREGQMEQAAARYDEVVTLSPNNAVALNNLAYILAETTDDLDRALTLAQRAVSASPDDPDIADTLGWVYIKKNLNDSAIGILDDLVVKQPTNVLWRYHLAMAHYQKGDYAQARSELETALRNNPTSDQETDVRRLLARVNP